MSTLRESFDRWKASGEMHTPTFDLVSLIVDHLTKCEREVITIQTKSIERHPTKEWMRLEEFCICFPFISPGYLSTIAHVDLDFIKSCVGSSSKPIQVAVINTLNYFKCTDRYKNISKKMKALGY